MTSAVMLWHFFALKAAIEVCAVTPNSDFLLIRDVYVSQFGNRCVLPPFSADKHCKFDSNSRYYRQNIETKHNSRMFA